MFHRLFSFWHYFVNQIFNFQLVRCSKCWKKAQSRVQKCTRACLQICVDSASAIDASVLSFSDSIGICIFHADHSWHFTHNEFKIVWRSFFRPNKVENTRYQRKILSGSSCKCGLAQYLLSPCRLSLEKREVLCTESVVKSSAVELNSFQNAQPCFIVLKWAERHLLALDSVRRKEILCLFARQNSTRWDGAQFTSAR